MGNVDLGQHLEDLLGRQVRRGAWARHAVGELLGLRELDQLLEVGRFETWVGDDDVGGRRHHDGGLVVGLGRVAGIGCQARVDRIGAGGDEDRVAVGVGLCDLARGDVAAGAAAFSMTTLWPHFSVASGQRCARQRRSARRPERPRRTHVLARIAVLGPGYRCGEKAEGSNDGHEKASLAGAEMHGKLLHSPLAAAVVAGIRLETRRRLRSATKSFPRGSVDRQVTTRQLLSLIAGVRARPLSPSIGLSGGRRCRQKACSATVTAHRSLQPC